MQAYCMKCRTKREMKDAKSITMKNGRPATQGVCPVCGTKMFRIGKSQAFNNYFANIFANELYSTKRYQMTSLGTKQGQSR